MTWLAGGGAARRDARGMVTAELAVATLTAGVVMVMLCWGILLAVTQVRCVEVAAEVARQAARGDQEAVQTARREAPAGAVVTVRTVGSLTRAEVTVKVQSPGGWLDRGVWLRADATVATEPGR